MNNFQIKYPVIYRYNSQYTDTNLVGTKSTTYNYATKNGTFVIHETPGHTSAVMSDLAIGKYVTQDVRYAPTNEVLSSKVTVVGKGKHNCSSVQAILKDGTYTLERSIDGKKVSSYVMRPEIRTFKGLKGLLEKAVLFVANDRNGCERVKLAPLANKLILKIRHI